MQPLKLLTFESWVFKKEWFEYAVSNPKSVPLLLVDRSICQEPFFDPYAPTSEERMPIISGLCRGLKNFEVGNSFVYITRIDKSLYKELKIENDENTSQYFGVAALCVKKVWDSHSRISSIFKSRQYVVAPSETPYPPNLVHNPQPIAALDPKSCILYDLQNTKPKAFIPSNATKMLWQANYDGYNQRMLNRGLQVAECEIEKVDGLEALQLDYKKAPVFTPSDWGGKSMQGQVMGIELNKSFYNKLTSKIAESNCINH